MYLKQYRSVPFFSGIAYNFNLWKRKVAIYHNIRGVILITIWDTDKPLYGLGLKHKRQSPAGNFENKRLYMAARFERAIDGNNSILANGWKSLVRSRNAVRVP